MSKRAYEPVDTGTFEDPAPEVVTPSSRHRGSWLYTLTNAQLFIVVVLLACILRDVGVRSDVGVGDGAGDGQDDTGRAPPGATHLLGGGAGGWQRLAPEDVVPAMPLWLHRPSGRVWADVKPVLGKDLLLVEQVTQGVGVRGLWDLSSIIAQPLVRLSRAAGGAVLLTAVMTAHTSSDPKIRPSVEHSFAGGVLWSFQGHDGDIEPTTAQDSGGGGGGPAVALWVDLTDWALRDSAGPMALAPTLTRVAGGQAYGLNRGRSALVEARAKARSTFSCVEARLTFVMGEVPPPLCPASSPARLLF
jgi:hypothetical protein